MAGSSDGRNIRFLKVLSGLTSQAFSEAPMPIDSASLTSGNARRPSYAISFSRSTCRNVRSSLRTADTESSFAALRAALFLPSTLAGPVD